MNSSRKKTSQFVTEQTQLAFGAKPLPIQIIKYDLSQYDDSLYSTFKIEQPSISNQWLVKRKAQFLAGRIAGKQALKAIDMNEKTIHTGTHREPLWGDSIIGSISHIDGASIATAQMKQSINQGIGLDIQNILSNQEIIDSSPIVLTMHDKKFLEKEVPEYSYNQLFSLLFSAKESFFKATFKEVGKHFDFDVMSLQSLDIKTQTLRLKCEKTVSSNIVRGSEYQLYFSYVEINKPAFISYCSYDS